MKAGDDKRRFPPPWKVELIPGGYQVLDSNGVPVAYVYAKDEIFRALTMDHYRSLSWDEARRIASGIGRLPDLITSARRRQ